MHECPGPDCTVETVPDDMLACSPHWYQVPKPLRTAVYRAWGNGAGAGTAAHRSALLAAVRTMRPLARKGDR